MDKKLITDHLRSHGVALPQFPTGAELHATLSNQCACDECLKYYKVFEAAPRIYSALADLLIHSEVLEDLKLQHKEAMDSMDFNEHDQWSCVFCNAFYELESIEQIKA